MNNIFEAENFEPGLTFENTVEDTKYNLVKSIISIKMDVSDITLNKIYFSS